MKIYDRNSRSWRMQAHTNTPASPSDWHGKEWKEITEEWEKTDCGTKNKGFLLTETVWL